MVKSKLIKIVMKESRTKTLKLLALATIAGLLQALVVVIINGASENIANGLNFRLFVMFAICITGFILTKRITLFGSVKYVYEIFYDMRLRIVDKVRSSNLKSFEKLGKAEIHSTLNQNTEIIIEAAKSLSHASSAAVMLIFSFIYIWFLSSKAFIMTVLLLLVGSYIYLVTNRLIGPKLRASRKKEAEFLNYLIQLLDGFKEVKMNRRKSDDLYENWIRGNSVSTRESSLETEILFIKNNLFVQIFFFMLIAAVVFILPQITEIDTLISRNIIAVLLFCIGSIVSVVQAIPIMSKADAALGSLEELESFLDSADDMKSTAKYNPYKKKEPFDEISFNNITFTYKDEYNSRPFTLGPVEFSIHSNEILFLTGGNGAGKSTLLKVIAGLYYPMAGEIICGGTKVDKKNYAHYRNLYSVIFTDFHLFDRLYGLKDIDENIVNDLLKQMEIGHSTSFVDDRFTNINLSTGQRKRLALIITYLEDKEIFIFDEVAAGQDPFFRDYFYTVLLKDLKAMGKTIIAATHDDRYFNVADRCLKMEHGDFEIPGNG
jgi:putative pyoverdin transport system ATP-binding/permease protein